MNKKFNAGAVWLRCVGTAAIGRGSREVTECVTLNQEGGGQWNR